MFNRNFQQRGNLASLRCHPVETQREVAWTVSRKFPNNRNVNYMSSEAEHDAAQEQDDTPDLSHFFEPNYILACNSLNKVTLNIGTQKHDWLLDSGASISAVKLESIQNFQSQIQKYNLVVNGLGGKVLTEGFVYLTLNYEGEEFEHKFYVFNELPCKTDGILGRDFFRKYRAKLDFEINTLNLITKTGDFLTLNFDYFTKNSSYLTVPARSEVIHYFHTHINYDCVINTQELCEGIYVASVIASPKDGKIPVKIMNTRDKDVTLNYFPLNITKPDQPRIVDIIKKPKDLVELLLIDERKALNRLEKEGCVIERYKSYSYVPSKFCIYLDSISRSSTTRDVLVRDLSMFCQKLKLDEICIIRNENNKDFIADIVREMNKYKDWSGPRICVLRNVQRINNEDDRKINPIVYKQDDYLLVKNEVGNKLDKVYLGPYLVLEDLGCNVKILKNGKTDIVHKNRTKPFHLGLSRQYVGTAKIIPENMNETSWQKSDTNIKISAQLAIGTLTYKVLLLNEQVSSFNNKTQSSSIVESTIATGGRACVIVVLREEGCRNQPKRRGLHLLPTKKQISRVNLHNLHKVFGFMGNSISTDIVSMEASTIISTWMLLVRNTHIVRFCGRSFHSPHDFHTNTVYAKWYRTTLRQHYETN
ncbi:hypothetical protein NE865_16356 [Phthorimaea operculella]|nr:hypothetical protein NE865_16356 [Phthorimaea operculella]